MNRTQSLGFLATALAGASLTSQVPQAATAGREGWHTDPGAAQVEAEHDGKDILLAFVCSDGAKVNAKLAKVFDAKTFKKFAAKHFVLVELDYPKQSEQSESRAENNRLAGLEYGVATHPVLLLADASGCPYVRFDLPKCDAKGLVRQLEKGRKLRAARDRKFAKADELEGTERARTLFSALQLLEPPFMEFYETELEEIVLLDEDNAAGLKRKAQPILEQCLRDRDHRFLRGNIATGLHTPQQAEAMILEFLEKHAKPIKGWEPLGELYNTLGKVLAHQKRWDDAIDWVKKARSIEPSEAKFFDRIIADYEDQRDAGGK